MLYETLSLWIAFDNTLSIFGLRYPTLTWRLTLISTVLAKKVNVPHLCELLSCVVTLPLLAVTFKHSYRLAIEKCFTSHRMGDGQIFIIFLATTAYSKAYPLMQLSTPVVFVRKYPYIKLLTDVLH